MSGNSYSVAVIHGDGIGPEVCGAALDVLDAALGSDSPLRFQEYPAGAEHYRRAGVALPDETFAACRDADAILHGAAGLPDVSYPDGTEVGTDFGLQLRFRLDLYANVRPIKLLEGVPSPLQGRSRPIDYVICRENTEGLYAARGGGVILRDQVATDQLVVTRAGIERISRFAFDLARRRSGAPGDGKRRVTLCDKANVLRTYAFFRKVFLEVAADYPDIEAECCYVDAMTAHMVLRPEHYDVIVAENMFGDIISDLGAATVGSMGMSPSSEIGDRNGFFQAAHGSAPDIAGKGIANPVGAILSGASMLGWLGARHHDEGLADASAAITRAVEASLRDGRHLTPDLGGQASTREFTDVICRAISREQQNPARGAA